MEASLNFYDDKFDAIMKASTPTGARRRVPYAVSRTRITPTPVVCGPTSTQVPVRGVDTVDGSSSSSESLVIAENPCHPLAEASARIPADGSVQSPEDDFENQPDDWLHLLFKRSGSRVLNYWELGYNTRLSLVHNSNGDLRIHIRDFVNENPQGGVYITPLTFFKFMKEFHKFNSVYTSASYIANNQLAVFSTNGACLLQQIFSKKNSFVLTPNTMKLIGPQVTKLQELCEDILQELMRCCIEVVLLQHAQEAITPCIETCVPVDEAEVLKCVRLMFENAVREVYECVGCEIDHPSQRRHPCMTETVRELSVTVREKAIISMNFRKTGKAIGAFVCKHDMENLKTVLQLENVLQHL